MITSKTMLFYSKDCGTLEDDFDPQPNFCLGPQDEVIVVDNKRSRVLLLDHNGNPVWQFGITGKLHITVHIDGIHYLDLLIDFLYTSSFNLFYLIHFPVILMTATHANIHDKEVISTM